MPDQVAPQIPNGLDELTPEWLTHALAEAFPGITVTEADLAGVLHGSAAKARLTIESEGASGVPPSFLVKASFTEGLGDDELAQAWVPLMRMMNETEGRFYTDVADLLGDRVPGCHAALQDATSAIIVLEDLNERAGIRFSTYDHPLDADRMAAVIDVLATLHAARWDDAELAREPLRDSFREGGMLDGFLSEVNWNQQMARKRGERVPEELTDFAHTTAAVRRAWDLKRSGPQCYVHGDPHVGNVFFDDAGAGLLDWQLFTSAHWASDLAYAIASGMEIEDRRAHERDLLAHYLERIESATGAAPGWDQAWLDYRRFTIWGFATYLTPGEGVQDEGYLDTVGLRHATSAVDHGAVALLDA